MRFTTLGSIAALVGTALFALHGANANPLIGKWAATRGDRSTLTGTNYCVIDWLLFTDKAETVHNIAVAGGQAYANTLPVKYALDVSPGKAFVYAYGDPMRGTEYDLIDANTIRMEDSNRCIYKRAK